MSSLPSLKVGRYLNQKLKIEGCYLNKFPEDNKCMSWEARGNSYLSEL